MFHPKTKGITKMKKLLLPALSLAAVVGMAALSNTARAHDGTLTFSGSITDITCTVSVNAGTADATITLPPLSTAAFPAAGTVGGGQPIRFQITNCASASGGALGRVAAHFDRTNTNIVRTGTYAGTLANTTTTGAAANVNLQLLDHQNGNRPINLSLANLETGVAIDNQGDANLLYFVEYISTAAAVTPGAVTSMISYDLTYN
jgi:major type 1 subunit fimbrin (pilin)